MHLIKDEFDRRIEAGAVAASLAAEARHLHDWLKNTHADQPLPGPGAIANALRETFNAAQAWGSPN